VTLRDCRILPGHRQWIDSVDDTILFYLRKLLDRTLKLKPFGKERNIAALIQRLFHGRELSHFQTYLKASEIIFMQDLLAEPQLLQTALEKAGLFDILADDFMRLDPRGAP
jgi:2,4-dienoyl-CoA reductase (NADPH2)